MTTILQNTKNVLPEFEPQVNNKPSAKLQSKPPTNVNYYNTLIMLQLTWSSCCVWAVQRESDWLLKEQQ